MLIESSGISEPMPVAETFTFKDEESGVSLGEVATLANLVTVVDAASLFEQLGTIDQLPLSMFSYFLRSHRTAAE